MDKGRPGFESGGETKVDAETRGLGSQDSSRYRGRDVRHKITEWLLQRIPLIIVAFLVLYPISMLVYGSFWSSSRITSPGHLTLDNFIGVISNPKVIGAVFNTLLVAAGTTAISVFVGVPLAWLVARTNMPGRNRVRTLTLLPFFTSSLLVGVSWAFLLSPEIGLLNHLFGSLGLPRLNIFSIGGIIWATGLYHIPYMFLFAFPAFQSIDSSLEESSQIAGAGVFATFRKVTFPLIAPSIASGAILVAVSSIGLFGIVAILGTPKGIFLLPNFIQRQVSSFPVKHNVAAAVSMLLLMGTLIFIAAQRFLVGRESRKYVTVSGKVPRARTVDLGKWRWPAAGTYGLFLLVGVLLPYLVLILVSISSFWSGSISFASLTSANYYEMFFGTYSTQVRTAFANSMLLGVGAATLSAAICLVIAWVIARGTGWFKVLAEFLALTPVAVPGIVFGVAFLWAWIRFPIQIYGTLWILIIAYVTRTIPHCTRVLGSNIIQISRDLEESARVSGASWGRVLKDVVFPLLRPGLIAAWAFVFILSVKELNTSILLVTPKTNVLATLIYDIYQEGFYVKLSALVVLESVVIIATLALFEYILKGRFMSER
jgi:iron(III) transport system permease protein